MKKIKRLWAMVLLLPMILSQPLSVYAAAGALPSGIAYDGLGKEIEDFVQEHKDTTVGMGLCYKIIGLGQCDAASNCHGFWVLAYGVETIGHGGNTAGCSSYLLLDLPNETGVVVMTNQANETVYNSEMMELIFGKFSEQCYFGMKRSNPEGIYRPARTVRTGPFKIISLSFTNGETETDEFWMTGTNSQTQKICYPYTDFVRVPFCVTTSGK